MHILITQNYKYVIGQQTHASSSIIEWLPSEIISYRCDTVQHKLTRHLFIRYNWFWLTVFALSVPHAALPVGYACPAVHALHVVTRVTFTNGVADGAASVLVPRVSSLAVCPEIQGVVSQWRLEDHTLVRGTETSSVILRHIDYCKKITMWRQNNNKVG